ncbi:MAG TPA: T9SS type A sorting domain-containing protein [Panacibacter sp.]|nr:T9SS type A sorting domain-containing protein [Panacibacter sp.]
MRKQLLIIALLFGSFLQITAQVTTEWVNQPRGVSIATDASNNVYTVDWEYNPGGDITLTKRNTSGNILWQVAYNNTDVTRFEVATWVETDNLGNILVSGTIRSGFSNPVDAASILMKYDAAGNLLWRKVYESSFDGSYTKKCLVDAANNIYVLGMGTGPLGFVTKVKKFAPNGNTVWTYYDNAGIGAPVNFKFTPDKKLVITGRGIYGSVNGYAKIDLNGNNIWNYPGVFSLYVGDAAGDSFGNTYLTHQEYVFNGRGEIKKLSPSGTLIWEKFHTMVGYRVEVGSDNAAVISGFPNGGTGGAAFMKYDSNGNVLWQNLDADGPSYSLLLHAQMGLDDDNNAYLAAGTLFDMAVCKVNSNGSSAWTQTATGGFAYGFDLGTDNNVYVVGGNTAKFVQTSLFCNTPEGLFTSNISNTKARFNWTLVNGAFQYEVWGSKVNTTVWKKTLVAGSKNFLVANSLSCGTNYEWKIRAICDSIGSKVSVFSALQPFTTSACATITDAADSESATAAADKKLIITPNPAKDKVIIQHSFNKANAVFVTVYNMLGKPLINNQFPGNNTLDVSRLPNGLYMLQLTQDKNILRSKLLIQR